MASDNGEARGFANLEEAYHAAKLALELGLLVEGVDVENRYAVAYHGDTPRWVISVRRLPVARDMQAFEAHSVAEIEAYVRITGLCRHEAIELIQILSGDGNELTARCTQCGLTLDFNRFAKDNGWLFQQAATVLLQMRTYMLNQQLEEGKSNGNQ